MAELENDDIDVDFDNEINEDKWRSFTEDFEKLVQQLDGMENFSDADSERLKVSSFDRKKRKRLEKKSCTTICGNIFALASRHC